MKFFAQIRNGELAFSGEQNELRDQHLRSFKPEDIVIETLTKHRLKRRSKQLGAWFGLFSKMVLAEFEDRGWDTSYIFKLPQPTGNPISEGLLKDYMYAMCPTYDKEGNSITMRKMDTGQMAKFFDECRNFAASQWCVNVPEPDKDWKKKGNKND